LAATSVSAKDTALGLRKHSVPVKKSPLVKQNSTANLAATILRKRIAEAEENTYLGSEADIALEVGVSLPTLRQTARMLEYEEVLLIKPGKGGGYFTRRPSIESAIRSASQFLSATDLNNNEMFMDAADTVMTQIVTNAVSCENPEKIAKLANFVQGQRNQDKSSPLSPTFSFKVSAGLVLILADMSNNVMLELFARILWSEISVIQTAGTFEENHEVTLENYSTRLALSEAVLARDEAKALLAWNARSDFLRSCPKKGFDFTRQSQRFN
jgi:DNA-binding FadR family transcriptional regulator